jgi:hypothetical protein
LHELSAQVVANRSSPKKSFSSHIMGSFLAPLSFPVSVLFLRHALSATIEECWTAIQCLRKHRSCYRFVWVVRAVLFTVIGQRKIQQDLQFKSILDDIIGKWF